MKEQIKELRVKVDGLAQLTKELKPIGKPILKINFHDESFDEVEKIQQFLKDWDSNPFSISVPESYPTEIIQLEKFKEIEKAVDSLYLGKAWLGKLMGELGNENPYGSGYKTKEDIVPTQDVATLEVSLALLNHVEKVDFLRSAIEEIVKEVKDIPTKDLSREFAIARTNCYTHLSEARFWLGFELERLKNEN